MGMAVRPAISKRKLQDRNPETYLSGYFAGGDRYQPILTQ
jgi:hypothetical protein